MRPASLPTRRLPCGRASLPIFRAAGRRLPPPPPTPLRNICYRGFRSWTWTRPSRPAASLPQGPPRPAPFARIALFSAANAAALGTAAFVELSQEDGNGTDGDGGEETTSELRMLEVSRRELQQKKKVGDDEHVLVRVLNRAILFLDAYVWEPVCTGLRFLHLATIFIPVIIAVPAIWIGPRQPDRENERSGTLWWYGRLVQSMEWAGPAFIKLGQWAASRTDIFPTEMCDIMSRLHSDAPAHSIHKTRQIIEAAFDGRQFEDIFSDFDETPLGVGAIAQVYRARLNPSLHLPSDADLGPPNDDYDAAAYGAIAGGKTLALGKDVVDRVLKSTPRRVPSRHVAVKVLHPGVERVVRRDLRIMGFFAGLLNIIPTMEWLSLPDEVAQFGDMMKLQLDLRIEAANLSKFRANFHRRTTAWFPYPYPDFTTRSVLVEEFAQGIPLSDFLDLGGGVFQEDIANEGLDAFLRMLLLDNFVHADLHPGNIMVRFYETRRPPQLQSIFSGSRSSTLPAPGMGGLDGPEDGAALNGDGDVTEAVLARLRPFKARHDGAGWVAELSKIDAEGFRPQLIFIDTGLVTELNATNRRNFLDLFRAVAEFDGLRAGQLMCERCRQPDAVIDKDVFALRMQRLVLDVKSRTLALGSIKIGDILQEVLTMVRNHHVRLEGDFVNVVISILLLEGIGRNLNPDADLLSSSLPVLRELGAKSGAGMAKGGDYSMLLVWAGLETRRFLQASVDDVERCVKYDLLSPNV